MAQDADVIVQLEASEERQLIARFVEYAYYHPKEWGAAETVEAIRSGTYLGFLNECLHPSEVGGGLS